MRQPPIQIQTVPGQVIKFSNWSGGISSDSIMSDPNMNSRMNNLELLYPSAKLKSRPGLVRAGSIPNKIIKIVRFDENNLLALDELKQVWKLDLTSGNYNWVKLTFVPSYNAFTQRTNAQVHPTANPFSYVSAEPEKVDNNDNFFKLPSASAGLTFAKTFYNSKSTNQNQFYSGSVKVNDYVLSLFTAQNGANYLFNQTTDYLRRLHIGGIPATTPNTYTNYQMLGLVPYPPNRNLVIVVSTRHISGTSREIIFRPVKVSDDGYFFNSDINSKTFTYSDNIRILIPPCITPWPFEPYGCLFFYRYQSIDGDWPINIPIFYKIGMVDGFMVVTQPGSLGLTGFDSNLLGSSITILDEKRALISAVNSPYDQTKKTKYYLFDIVEDPYSALEKKLKYSTEVKGDFETIQEGNTGGGQYPGIRLDDKTLVFPEVDYSETQPKIKSTAMKFGPDHIGDILAGSAPTDYWSKNFKFTKLDEGALNVPILKDVVTGKAQEHLYLTSEDYFNNDKPQKLVVREDAPYQGWMAAPVGLPRIDVGTYNASTETYSNPPTIVNTYPKREAKHPTGEYVIPRGRYSFAFVVSHTYKSQGKEFLREGPIFFSKSLELEQNATGSGDDKIVINPFRVSLNAQHLSVLANYPVGVKIDLYRTKMNGTVYYKVPDPENFQYVPGNADNNKIITDWVIFQSDEEIDLRVLYNTEGSPDKYQPPDNTRMMHLMGNVAYYADQYRVYQAIPGEPESVPRTYYVEFERKVQGLSSIRNQLLIMTESEIYNSSSVIDRRRQGAINAQKIHETAGCISNRAIVSNKTSLVWLGRSCVYVTDGYQVQEISRHLDGFYKKHISSLTDEQKRSIEGIYDGRNNRIVWTIPYADDLNINVPQGDQIPLNINKYFLILDLNFSRLGEGMGCFYTWTGKTAFEPECLLGYDQNIMFGHTDGSFLKFDEKTLNDPMLNAPTGKSFYEPILWDIRSSKIDLNIPEERNISKWFALFNPLTSLLYRVVIDTEKHVMDSQPVQWLGRIVWGQKGNILKNAWNKAPLINHLFRVSSSLSRSSYGQFRATNDISVFDLVNRTLFFSDKDPKIRMVDQDSFSVGGASVPATLTVNPSTQTFTLTIGSPYEWLDIWVGRSDIVDVVLDSDQIPDTSAEYWNFQVVDKLSDQILKLQINPQAQVAHGTYELTKWRLLGIPRNQAAHILHYGYEIQGYSQEVSTQGSGET